MSERWYQDACGIAHALEFVGERWALLVMRELMFGPRRFSELRSALPGISAKVLTQRLDGLEAAAIVRRRQTTAHHSVQVYELTRWGRQAKSAMMSLGRWAVQSPLHDSSLPMSPTSLMMALQTMLNRNLAAARGDWITLLFRFTTESLVGELAEGELSIQRGEKDDVDVTFRADPVTLGTLIFGKVPAVQLKAAGALEVMGDEDAATRFIELFSLPDKITD